MPQGRFSVADIEAPLAPVTPLGRFSAADIEGVAPLPVVLKRPPMQANGVSGPATVTNSPAKPITVDRNTWDLRPDGTKKGDGFLGVLQRPDGVVMSEYSIADSEKLKDAKGNYLDYPTLVPTLTKQEVQTILNLKEGEDVPASIKRKAEAHALARVAKGEPVWAQPGEQRADLFPEFTRAKVVAEPLKPAAASPALPVINDPDLAFSAIASQSPAAQGPGQVARGVRDVATSLFTPPSQRGGPESPLPAIGEVQPTPLPEPTKKALSDVIEGVFNTAQPLVASALVLSPVTTAIALGVATAADKAARDAVAAMGGSEESQRLAGNVAAALAAGKGTEVVIRQAKADIKALGIKARVAGDAAKAVREEAGTITPNPTDIVVNPERVLLPEQATPARPGDGLAPTPIEPLGRFTPTDIETVAPAPAAPVVPERPVAVPPSTVAPGTAVPVPEPPGGAGRPDRWFSPGEEAGIRQLEELQRTIHGEEVPTKGNGTFRPEDIDAPPTYEHALNASREAERVFAQVTADYRAKKIGDDAYLAARKIRDDAARVFDVAFAAEQQRVDTLPTGEQQPRLPEAGAVRDQNVATPQIEAPFSLSGGVSERPTGQQGGLLDTIPAQAQTSPRESVGQNAGAGTGAEGRAAGGGVPASYPGSRRESPRQREARRTAHYNDVFPHVLDAAQAVDPTIDPAHLRAEFDDQVNFLDEQHREFQGSGRDPKDLLRAVAKYGGFGPESAGGLTGELRWLKEGSRGGVAGGVANVFRSKRELDSRGVPVKGLPFDVMVQRLQQDPRFAWVENTDILIDAIDHAIRHPATADTFPGTDELATTLGMDPSKVWWRAKGGTSDASDAGLEHADASFNPSDFEQGGGGQNASVGSYARHVQEELQAIAAPTLPPPSVPGAGGSGFARPAEFPELVDLARELQGTPQVKRSLGKNRGVFTAGGIKLVADLFTPGNEYQLAATLAHEIGHLVDFLPDRTLKRGNILGRLRSLQSFLKGTFTAPDGTTISNKTVKTELQALSDEWRPWNPETASASFTAYRRSSKELYADAISVLLNNPGMLASKAPMFYKAFFAALDAKPEVERAYFDLQEVLSGTPEELIARRRAGVRKMFEEGDVTALELERRRLAEQEAKNHNLWFRLKVQHLDKNYAFIDRVHQLQKQGTVVPASANPVYDLEERNYVGGKLKAFTERVFAPIFKAVTDADIHWHAFSEALFYERIIAGDRSEMANPRGLSPATAGELLEALKTELGPEKAAVIRRAATAFRAAVKGVAEDAYQAGLYTDDLHKQMQENPAYVTFQVIDHMDNAVTSRVHRQVGTLKDVANVADSTILKTLVTLRAIEHQKVKQAAFGFLQRHFPRDITPAKTVWSGKGHRPIESKDPNQKLITYYEKGTLAGYYVDPYITDSLNNESIGQNNAVVSILRRINSGIFRPVFTTFNLGFQSFNFARDFERFWKNTPGMTLKRAVQRYAQAVPLARIRAFGPGSGLTTTKQIQAQADMIAAEESKMLSVTMNDLVTGRQVEDSQIEDILTRVGVGGFGQRQHLWFTKPFLAVLDLIRETGDFIETLPKAAGIYEFKGAGSIAEIPADQRSFIRRKVGSPDFLTKGTYTPVSNEVFLFSNAAAQAIRSDYEVATDPKTRSGWWWKTAKATLLPKLLMAAALAGLMGDQLRRLLERASEYDRTNYTILPLGEDGNGNAVYIRLPQDQTSQLIGGIFWKFLQLFRGDTEVLQTLGQVTDYTAGQIPSVAPSVSAIRTASELVAGQNPYDTFRGRNLFTDDEWRARDRHTFMKFLGWEFQQLGGGIVWKFFPGEERPKTQTVGQRILDLPVLSNIVGRFVRITNYGDTEALRAAQGEVQRDEARRRLNEREAVDDAIRTYQKVPASQRSGAALTTLALAITKDLYAGNPQEAVTRFPEIQTKLRVGVVKGEASPVLDALLAAQSKAQRAAILQAWLKRRPTAAAPATAR